MKTTLLIFLITPILSFSQANDLVRLAGTKVAMIIPKNYTISSSFKGFEKSENGTNKVEVEEFQNYNYLQNEEKIIERSIKNFDGKVIQNQKIKIDDFSATFLLLEKTKYKSCQLYFGDNDFMVGISSFLRDISDENIDAIKKSLLSTHYEKKMILSAYDRAIFTANDSGSQFKLSRISGDIFQYTKNGIKEDVFKKSNESYIINQIRLKENTSAEMISKEKYSNYYFNILGFELKERKNYGLKNINGYEECYQEIFYGKMLGKDTEIKTTVLVKNLNAVNIISISNINDTKLQNEFDKITNTIILK
jgi:hypothetical protein